MGVFALQGWGGQADLVEKQIIIGPMHSDERSRSLVIARLKLAPIANNNWLQMQFKLHPSELKSYTLDEASNTSRTCSDRKHSSGKRKSRHR